MVSNNGTKFCVNPFTLLKVIESSNICSRNTLAKMKTQDNDEIRTYIKGHVTLNTSDSHT